MASASGAALRKKVVPVAASIMLVLLSMGSPAMADIQDNCRAFCIPQCNAFASKACDLIIDLASLKNNLPFFNQTCNVRLAQLCLPVCMNACTLNTLTPGAPTPARAPAPAGAAPPPCKA
ncbi:hypothetical protein PVAP13_8KG374300 [Panicum virgatum]|uniref:Uncharacterized protein n=1 Tax=Panicum virgatum TaxID=38727 RepID=A0A8T0PYC2_PANVG|nr:hypothetical protein PVAP13_8KG374300 [Panicum virgatum]